MLTGDLFVGQLILGDLDCDFRPIGDTLLKRLGEIDGFFVVPPSGDLVSCVE